MIAVSAKLAFQQIDFNMANDKHLTRLNEKTDDADTVLNGLHDQLKDTMGLEYYHRAAIHEYKNLESNFEKLCAKFRYAIFVSARLDHHFVC